MIKIAIIAVLLAVKPAPEPPPMKVMTPEEQMVLLVNRNTQIVKDMQAGSAVQIKKLGKEITENYNKISRLVRKKPELIKLLPKIRSPKTTAPLSSPLLRVHYPRGDFPTLRRNRS